MKAIESVSRVFFFFSCEYQIVLAPFVENTMLFFYWIAFAHLSTISWLCVDIFLGFLFYSMINVSVFIQYHAVLINVVYSRSWSHLCLFVNFVLSLQYCVGCCGSFSYSHKPDNQFIDFYQINCWDFDWDCVESIGEVGKSWHVNNKSSDPSTWNLSPFI